jgi:hypothetical protein
MTLKQRILLSPSKLILSIYLSFIVFLILMGISMVVWPDGYSFWGNYISDLGMLTTFLDLPNPVSSTLMTFAFLIISIGSVIFYNLLYATLRADLPVDYKKNVREQTSNASYLPGKGLYARMRRNIIIHWERYLNDWTIYGIISGICSAISINGVNIFPKYHNAPEFDLVNLLHGLFAFLLFFCAALSMIFYFVVLFYRFPKFRYGIIPLMTFWASFLLYLILPRIFTDLSIGLFCPSMQKIVTMFFILTIISFTIICKKILAQNQSKLG